MPYVLKKETLAGLTTQDVGTIRKLKPQTARQWITLNHPQLEAAAVDDLMAMLDDIASRVKPRTVVQIEEVRSYFLASAWLLGASWGQLSNLFQVTRSTVLRSAERRFGFGADRQAIRLVSSTMIYSEVVALWDSFKTIVSDGVDVKDYTSVELANLLLDHSRQQPAEDDPSAPERRITGTKPE